VLWSVKEKLNFVRRQILFEDSRTVFFGKTGVKIKVGKAFRFFALVGISCI